LGDQDLDQRAMIPWCGADAVLDNLALDIDQGGNILLTVRLFLLEFYRNHRKTPSFSYL